jgi:murein DD-endopeptidase MepM/ murein hydrolase activator NlpD
MFHNFQTLIKNNNIRGENIVPFHPDTDRIKSLNLSDTNPLLTPDVFNHTKRFAGFIEEHLQGARYGIGGYMENRTVYSRSRVFDGTSEPRTLHLGVDIWGAPGTPVMAPISGILHSKGNHPEYGNYGATLVMQHQIEELIFYTLYGHLSERDLILEPGTLIPSGSTFAHFGTPKENGHWPPHLHFQVILDLQGASGDYPGVCAISERDFYQQNCPNPAIFLPEMVVHAR